MEGQLGQLEGQKDLGVIVDDELLKIWLNLQFSLFMSVCRNTQKKLRVFVGFVDFKCKFCCEFRSWMFLHHSKWITSCFDGLNIPSYLAYSTFLVITNRDFYGLLDSNTVPVLNQSMVRPHLEYGNVIWGSFFKEDITAVEKVQRKATKVVPELKDHPYETRLRALKLPSLLHRRSDTI